MLPFSCPQYDPTVEESYQTTVDIDGKALQIEILDTAGQDEYTPLRETFMHTGDGFLLVYSITDDQTFEELNGIREQILRVHPNRKVPMLVVGNKLDLASKDRAVTKEEGKTFAKTFDSDVIEVSVRSRPVICFLSTSFYLTQHIIYQLNIYIYIHLVGHFVQAKENFKVKEAFESLIRTVMAGDAAAGRSEGSGSVFGAGKIDK